MKKRIAMAAAGLIAFSLTACGGNAGSQTDESAGTETSGGSSDDERIVLRVGEQASCKYFTLAEEQGIFEEYFDGYDFTVEYYDFGGGPAMNEAFAAGELDAGILGVSPAISGISNDYGYHIVSKIRDTYKGTWLITTPDSGIESVADLEGRRVGTTLGGSWQYILDVWLAENGMTEADIQLINSGSETATGIRTGELDAAVQNAATSNTLIQEGSAVLVTNESSVSQADMIVLADAFAEQYPEFTEQFMLAMDATAKWINENPDEFIKFYAECTGTDEDIVRETHDLYLFEVAITEADIECADEQLAFVKDQGNLADDSITVDDLFDLSLLEKAGLQ